MTGLATNEGTERAVALRSALAERVVVADGAMGTMLQASEATADDFAGLEGCNESSSARGGGTRWVLGSIGPGAKLPEPRTRRVRPLESGRIGVGLSDEMQLHPVQSTDAIVIHHPEAKYFSV